MKWRSPCTDYARSEEHKYMKERKLNMCRQPKKASAKLLAHEPAIMKISTPDGYISRRRVIYIAGPMRGYRDFNFPAFFDMESKLQRLGFLVLSPARHDTEIYGDTFKSKTGKMADLKNGFNLRSAFSWDADCILRRVDSVVFLDGWEKSSGACIEYALAKIAGLKAYDERLKEITAGTANISVQSGEVRIPSDRPVTQIC